MQLIKNTSLIQHAQGLDLSICLTLNRWIRHRNVHRFFRLISRLGDGIFWYTLILVVALTQGIEGLQAALHMLLVAATGVTLYKKMKHRFIRERPFVTHCIITPGTDPLDRHSFPSGHTLHAVAFSIIALSYYPSLDIVLIPFALFVAMSRIVLGLHYPSDVLIGTVIGCLLAYGSLYLPMWPFMNF